jgi:hypothetical protein
MQLESDFDAAWYEGIWQGIAGTSLWACFAVRNAAVNEAAIPPEWRQELSNLATSISPESDWSHLQRDWVVEQEKWEVLKRATPSAADTENRVEQDPRSLSNTLKQLESEDRGS